jgi:hypothetical protein
VKRLVFTLLASALGCGGADVRPPADTGSPVVKGDLEPVAFPALPADVRADLAMRGCKVPQSYPDTVPHNVVRGQLTAAGQTDIAVLCLARDTATILVYRQERADDVVELEPRAESEYRQVVPGGTLEFSRALGVATPEFIRSRRLAWGGPTPPPLDHDGVNDIYVGKGSVVWYWHRGRWLQLQGSD